MNPLGSTNYDAIKADAQRLANATGLDCGIERMVAGRRDTGRVIWYALRILPAPECRQGVELFCEVVAPAVARGRDHG